MTYDLWHCNISVTRILLPPHPCHSDNLIPPGSTHYGHSGIVESARDLYEQIDGNPENKGME